MTNTFWNIVFYIISGEDSFVCIVLKRSVHKVNIYRVCPLVRNLTSPFPSPHPASESVPPSPERKGGGTHSPAGEGVRESQFGRLEKQPGTLFSVVLLASFPTRQRRLGIFNPILTHQGWIWLCLVWAPISLKLYGRKIWKKIKFYHVGLLNILINSHKAVKLTIS